jgi:hypothetical protein
MLAARTTHAPWPSPVSSLTFGRPCSALSLLACPHSHKRRLPASRSQPYVRTTRPRAPLRLRRQTATFAALATCASETVPALENSQTAAAGGEPDSANSHRFHSAPLQRRQRTAPLTRAFIPLLSTSGISGDRREDTQLSWLMRNR